MAYEIKFLPAVEDDINDAVDWYLKINSRLTFDFLLKFESALDNISKNPESFQKVFKTVSKYSLLRFPYKIIFRTEGNTILIIALAHHKRHPKFWKRRT